MLYGVTLYGVILLNMLCYRLRCVCFYFSSFMIVLLVLSFFTLRCIRCVIIINKINEKMPILVIKRLHVNTK